MTRALPSICLACGGSNLRPLVPPSEVYGVLVCAACGLGRTAPDPTDAELTALYSGDYTDVSARKFASPLERARRLFARSFARRVRRRAGVGGRLLDVGCGDGKVLIPLARAGFVCTGTEINPRIRETLPAGITVHIGRLEEAGFPTGSFRIVLLRHVLEHLREPVATLQEIRRVVEPDGRLVIAVPNLGSWQARATRAAWFHLDLPRHLHHFTPASLTAVLEQTGFVVERISHFSFEQNPYGWLQSGFNMAGGRWREFYDQLRAPGATHARAPDRIALAGALAILPLCTALSVVESAAHAGGTIEVWARPR
jgi:2-polyprenyl-3-methyl-5-hydroxy-6-metoxy-1,4-benzoquinol methylase